MATYPVPLTAGPAERSAYRPRVAGDGVFGVGRWLIGPHVLDEGAGMNQRAVLPAMAGDRRHHLLQRRKAAVPGPTMDLQDHDPVSGRRRGGGGLWWRGQRARSPRRTDGDSRCGRAARCTEHLPRRATAIFGSVTDARDLQSIVPRNGCGGARTISGWRGTI